VIDGGSGYLCQMEAVAHFGLGENSFPCHVHVRWPNGVERSLGPVKPGQTLRVPHP
jgi:predicted Zn-dependent protease